MTPPTADDWPTYHRDPVRSGAAPGPPWRAVAPAWHAALDGDLYAEPLVVGGRVIAATANDTVYALDLDSGRVVWHVHLAAPVPLAHLPCGDVDPVGITGTPVADPARQILYVAAMAAPVHHELYAMSLSDGSVLWHRAIDAPGADPRVHNQRGALALAGGLVYVPFGGQYGDCGNYHGELVAVRASGGGPLSSFRVPSARAAGLWAPPGPSLGPAGQLYVTTGNSFTGGPFDFGDSVLQLSQALRLDGWFAAPDWAYRDSADADLGSVGPTLLPGGLIFQTGKLGTAYLISTAHMGGVGGQIFSGTVCDSAYGGTAYAGGLVYVPCLDGLVAVRVGSASFQVAWRSAPFHAEPPIVAGGLVWTVDRDSAELLGLDPRSGRVSRRFPLGRVVHFVTASESAGVLLVGAGASIRAFRGS
ncbi:MAG: PQQ-binding-like beta-propeller repeat protein [Candidatus Dormibacterales bacterium]